jgi:hypothetical protein
MKEEYVRIWKETVVVYSRHPSGETEENHEKTTSRSPYAEYEAVRGKFHASATFCYGVRW